MGLGHIITLQVPAGAFGLNLAIENGAWGAYDCKYSFPTIIKPFGKIMWKNGKKQRLIGTKTPKQGCGTLFLVIMTASLSTMRTK